MSAGEAEALTLFTETAPGQFHPADHWTSKAAAAAVAVKAGTTRYLVLGALVDEPTVGHTAYELAARLHLLAHVAGTRLGELVAAGLAMALEVDGRPVRRPTDTGRTAAAHVATLAGMRAHSAAAAAMAPRTTDRPLAAGARPPGRPARPTRPSPRGLTRPLDLVLEAIVDAGIHGATDSELGDATGRLATAAGTYRKQLTDAGLVERTDRTRKTLTGRQPAAVHIATRTGRLRLLNLELDIAASD